MMMTSSNHAARRTSKQADESADAKRRQVSSRAPSKTNACFGVTQAHQRLTASDEDKTLCLNAYHSKSTTLASS